KVRHWGSGKQLRTRSGQPARPTCGSRHSCAVGRDSGICIHLPVNFGDQDEGQAGSQRFYKPRTHPDGPKTVKIIPDQLSAAANLLAGHGRMGPKELGPKRSRNQPTACDRNSSDGSRRRLHHLLPTHEIYRARVGSNHNELRKRDLCLGSSKGGDIECFRPVTRETKDERSEHVDPVATKGSQAIDEVVASTIELLVNVLQPLRSDRLYAHQSSFDVRRLHGIEKLRIFSSFHCDLGEENGVWR